MAHYAMDSWMTSPAPSTGLIFHPRRTPSSGERAKRQRSRSRSGALQCLAVHQVDDDDDDWYRAAPEPHWPPRNRSVVVTSSPFRALPPAPLLAPPSLLHPADYAYYHGEAGADYLMFPFHFSQLTSPFQGDSKVNLKRGSFAYHRPLPLAPPLPYLPLPPPTGFS